MAKAKTKKPTKPKPKKTTATIDTLIFVFDNGEVVSLDAASYRIVRSKEIDLRAAQEDAVEEAFDEFDYQGIGPVDVYRITREVPLPVQSQPEPLGMFIPRDGPLVTPPSKKQRGK